MRIEVIRPLAGSGRGNEEVLHLRKGQEYGRLQYIDAKTGQGGMVQIEGVLQRQLPVGVGILHACVLDDIDGLGGPPSGEIAHDTLQEHGPLAGEADEERWHVGQAIITVEAGLRNVIHRNWWRSGG